MSLNDSGFHVIISNGAAAAAVDYCTIQILPHMHTAQKKILIQQEKKVGKKQPHFVYFCLILVCLAHDPKSHSCFLRAGWLHSVRCTGTIAFYTVRKCVP